MEFFLFLLNLNGFEVGGGGRRRRREKGKDLTFQLLLAGVAFPDEAVEIAAVDLIQLIAFGEMAKVGPVNLVQIALGHPETQSPAQFRQFIIIGPSTATSSTTPTAATTAITAATITTRFWSIPPGDWPRPAPSLDGLLNALIIPLMLGSFHSFNFFFKFDPCSGLTLRILGNFLQGTLYLFFCHGNSDSIKQIETIELR